MKLMMEEDWEEEKETSECSSGCQSGWTMYLTQSHDSIPRGKNVASQQGGSEDDDYEEDRSMISDASSGPPHFIEDDQQCSNDSLHPFAAKNGGKRRRFDTIEQRPSKPEHTPFLDDTATSLFNFSEGTFNDASNSRKQAVTEFSYGFSATHLKAKSQFQKRLGRLQSPSSMKPASATPSMQR